MQKPIMAACGAVIVLQIICIALLLRPIPEPEDAYDYSQEFVDLKDQIGDLEKSTADKQLKLRCRQVFSTLDLKMVCEETDNIGTVIW